MRISHLMLGTQYLGINPVDTVCRQVVRYLWSFSPRGRGRPNWANIFIDACLSIQQSDRSKSIMLGGMVTLIANRVGVDLSNMKPISRRNHLDIGEMVKFGMNHSTEDRYMWCYGAFEQFYMILPPPGGFRWLSGYDVFVSLEIKVDQFEFFKFRPLSDLVPEEYVFQYLVEDVDGVIDLDPKTPEVPEAPEVHEVSNDT